MNFDLNIILYIVFGVLPSLIWLFYYLRKDNLPESRLMILKIFAWGAVITLPVFFAQVGMANLLEKINLDPFVASILYWFIVIAFSEEFFKYLIIRLKVINSYHLDEPIDVMIYMVVAALGFTAVENILYIFAPTGQYSFTDLMQRTLLLSFVRFIGATFLHTLCSAVIGYLLALSLCKLKNKWIYMITGLFTATVLHGLYDFSIIGLKGDLKIYIPLTILVILAILTSLGFEHLKKLKSVCKLD
jgi:RsiW-degrading membrane proteinase PrsW (M82 family)